MADGATFENIDVAVTLTGETTYTSYVGGLLAEGTGVTISDITLPAKVFSKMVSPDPDVCKCGSVSGALAGNLSKSKVTNIEATGASTARASTAWSPAV